MINYKVQRTVIESDGKKATIFRIVPNPGNIKPNQIDSIVGGVPITTNIGEDETAKSILEQAISDYLGTKSYNRFNEDGNPYSVVIVE